jgi:hypothetical protein
MFDDRMYGSLFVEGSSRIVDRVRRDKSLKGAGQR